MQEIVSHVYTFNGLKVGRVYLITAGDGLTLIDAGIASAGKRILRQMEAVGHNPADLKRIIITHAHSDHCGAVQELKQISNAEIIVPHGERAVFDGDKPVPQAPTLLKIPITLPAGLKADRTVQHQETLAEVLNGLQAIETPGHTPGHMAYWQPEQRILFCGDAIFNIMRMTLPLRMATVNMKQNIQSIGRLAALEPKVICFGHGRPIVTKAAQRLRQFAEKVGAFSEKTI